MLLEIHSMKNISKGDVEYYVVGLMLKEGLDVFLPMVDDDAIDVDCLIAKRTTSDFHQSEVVEDAAKAVEELRKRRFKIVIFSLNFPSDSQVVRKWLSEKGIRFDEFLLFKPKCDLVIDDKAVKLNGWKGILETLT